MYPLTLQVHANGIWQDAMTLSFAQPEQGFMGPCAIAYEPSYVRNNLDAYESFSAKAVSARLPVDFDSFLLPAAPASFMTSPHRVRQSGFSWRIWGEQSPMA